MQNEMDGLFHAYKRFGLEFAFADTDMEQVYKPGALRETMQTQHGAQGFNCGCFVSSRGVPTLPKGQAAAGQAAGIKSGFVSQYEQLFFNYLVDISGARQGSISGIYAAYGSSIWAALTPLRGYKSACRLMANGSVRHPMPMLHWAGYRCESQMPNALYFLRYRLRHGTLWERLAFLHRFSQRQRAAAGGMGSRAFAPLRPGATFPQTANYPLGPAVHSPRPCAAVALGQAGQRTFILFSHSHATLISP